MTCQDENIWRTLGYYYLIIIVLVVGQLGKKSYLQAVGIRYVSGTSDSPGGVKGEEVYATFDGGELLLLVAEVLA